MENVLLILHEFQGANPHHFLSENDLAMIARYLNESYSSIYGIVSYYTMFSFSPRGKHIIRVCISPVCQMDGSNAVLTQIRKSLNITSGETTGEGLFTLETTECLGQCDTAPGMSIDEKFYGNLTPKKIMAILQKYGHTENGTGRNKR